MKKVLDSSYQVYLCNQNPDKRKKLPARQTHSCAIPVPVPHCITTLLTSNSAGSFLRKLYVVAVL